MNNYVKVEAEKRFPDFNINFKKIDVILSPGVKIKGLKVALKEEPAIPVYVSNETSVSMSIWSWLKGSPRYYFESETKGGLISGFLDEKNEVKKERVDARINLESITLDESRFIHPLLNERIEGKLTGKITFMGDLSNPLKGNTEISLALTDGIIKLKETIFDLNTIGFKSMNISGVIDNRRLNLKSLDMTGGPINCTASGTVRISNELLNSRLNIKSEIEPSPSLAKEMPGVERALKLIKNKMKNGKLRVDLLGTLDRPIPKFR